VKKFIIFLSCAIVFTNLACAKYYSQIGQDKFVYEHFFKQKKNGVFVDIGAHDGISYSNTYFFEKNLGWTGICVEPIPEIFTRLKQNRNCTCIQACVAEKTKQDKFLYVREQNMDTEMLSGLLSNFNPDHVQRIERESSKKNQIIFNVTCYSFNELLEKYGITHINFLSLDTEGSEFEILNALDFSKYTIDVITVEENHHYDNFMKLLTSKGYHLEKVLQWDLVFVNNNFKPQSK